MSSAPRPSSKCIRRLNHEYSGYVKDPLPNCVAKPLDDDILQWIFMFKGDNGTPYEGGIYIGKIIFPVDYPWKPPALQMITPNGRFVTNMNLCLSISNHHPESWNPLWNVKIAIKA